MKPPSEVTLRRSVARAGDGETAGDPDDAGAPLGAVEDGAPEPIGVDGLPHAATTMAAANKAAASVTLLGRRTSMISRLTAAVPRWLG
jgi:hypothetical protein